MKNLKLLLILCFGLTPFFALAQSCNYTLVLQDSWGDGWGGTTATSIDVDVAGTVTNYTFDGSVGVPAGGEIYFSIPVAVGDALSLTVTPGQFPTETAYELRDATGAVIHSDGTVPCLACGQDDGANGITSGEVFTTTAACPSCTQPTATTTIVEDCANVQFFVDVNVSDLGDADSLVLSTDVNGTEATISATGTTQVGPFLNGAIVAISLTHNVDADCNLSLAPVSSFCPITACHADDMLTNGAVAVCPGEVFFLATNGSDTIPNSPIQGGFGWFFDASQGGTGGPGFSFTLSNAGNPAAYDANLNGLLGTDMTGTWVISAFVYGDAESPNTSICAISSNSLAVTFLDEAPVAATMAGGSDACYNSTLTATEATAAVVPTGTVQYYLLVAPSTAVLAYSTTPSFDFSTIDFAAVSSSDCGDFTINSIVIDAGYDFAGLPLGGFGTGGLATAFADGDICGDIDQIGTPYTVACSELMVTTTSTVEACGGMDGTATVAATGGTSAYTYLWENGVTDATVTGLSAGNYIVVVTDMFGCVAEGEVVVNSASGLGATMATSMDVTCRGDADGAISITPTGGATPYTYLWTNGTTAQNLTGVGPGTYEVTVTDDNGCPFILSGMVINEPNSIGYIIDFVNTSLEVACNGDMTGALVITFTGGTTPYTFAWSNGATTESITGLGVGAYQGTVTDANGCTLVSPPIPIAEPDPVGADVDFINTVLTVTCKGAMDGAILITATGGTPPYTFIWTNGATTESITGLGVGTYQGTITDANGCTLSSPPLPVNEPDAVAATETVVDETAPGNGTIDLAVSGGTAPYTYVWSNGATTANLTGLTADDYSVTITDINGCTLDAGPYTVDDLVANKDIEGLNSLLIQPNPTTGLVSINIELDRAMEVNFSLYTITGLLLDAFEEGSIVGKTYELDLSAYAGGVYMARFMIDGQSISKKIILTK